MGNFNPNYFDRKSGSLEEAIRGAVSGKIISEGTVNFQQHDGSNKDFQNLVKKNKLKIKTAGDGGQDSKDTVVTGDAKNIEKLLTTMYGNDWKDFYNVKGDNYVEEQKSIKEGFSPKEIKMAIGIAGDPRYKGGNMTGAVKAIEKIKDGLSDDPKVAAALKKMNEGSKEEYQKFFNATLKKFKIDSPADLKSDEEKKKFFNYIDKNYTGEKDEAYIASMRETKKWAGLSEMAYKPGSFKDTKAQEKGAKALDGLIKTGGMDKKDFQKARGLYVQAADAGSRNKLKNFIFNLDTEPKEAIMDVIGRNDPSTFLQMYPDAKEGEPLTTTAFKHRSMKSENYGIGTPENTKSKLNATPGQSVDDWKQQVEVMHKKQASMREALAKVWGVDEGHNPFDNKKEEKKAKKEDKTMTGKPMTKIKVDPDMKEVKLGKKNVR